MKIFISLFFIIFIFFLAEPAIPRSSTIALHYSECSESISHGKPLEQITFWELFFLKKNIEYTVIYDDDIESGPDPSDYHTIIFSKTECLSNNAFNAIEEYVESGGNIIIFGSFGMYDEKLNYSGWSRFELFAGIQFKENLPKDSISSLLKIIDHQPLTNGISVEKNIRFTLKDAPSVASIYSDDVISVGNISFKLHNDVEEKILIFYGKKNNGELLWSSVGIHDIIGDEQDIRNFETLILNFISLNSGKTFGWLDKNRTENKPDLTVLFDISYNTNETDNILKLAEKYKLKPGFIFSPSETNMDLLKSLSLIGELIPKYSGSLFSDLQKGFIENQHFTESLKEIEETTGTKIRSALVTENLTNKLVIDQFAKSGIEYILFPDYQSPPEVHSEILFIPVADTWNEMYSVDENKNTSYGPLARFSNELYKRPEIYSPLLIYNSEIDCNNDLLNKFELFLNHLTSDDHDISAFEEYLKWRSIVNNTKVSVRKTDDMHLEITISNYSKLNTGSIRVESTDNFIRSANEISMMTQNADVNYYFERSSGKLKIFIDNINKGNSMVLSFALN